MFNWFTLVKRLSEDQKEEIIQSFNAGMSILELSEKFGFSKLTISRNLKKNIGENEYKQVLRKSNSSSISSNNMDFNNNLKIKKDPLKSDSSKDHINEVLYSIDMPTQSFVEIIPLDHEIDKDNQKELSSIPLESINFPKLVYMVVDKKIELEIKLLKDYPEWEFLPLEDLERKTIEVFLDLKKAKRVCNKDQKVIKVPNVNVFKLVAPILLSRGISRIISDDQLISLWNQIKLLLKQIF